MINQLHNRLNVLRNPANIFSFILLIIALVLYFEADAVMPVIFLLLMAWPLALFAIIFSIFTLVDTLFLSKRGRKIILPIYALIVLLIFLPPLPGNRCDAYEMAAHYDKHAAEFQELKAYMCAVLNDGCGVKIEFEANDELAMCHIYNPKDSRFWSNHWDEDAVLKGDSLLQVVGIDREKRNIILRKLRALNCISVEASAHGDMEVGYKRILMGKYSYRITNEPPTPEAIQQNRENTSSFDSSSIYYRDNVWFVYGSGAIGSNNFPGKADFLFSIVTDRIFSASWR
jgi:hypothetical protein